MPRPPKRKRARPQLTLDVGLGDNAAVGADEQSGSVAGQAAVASAAAARDAWWNQVVFPKGRHTLGAQLLPAPQLTSTGSTQPTPRSRLKAVFGGGEPAGAQASAAASRVGGTKRGREPTPVSTTGRSGDSITRVNPFARHNPPLLRYVCCSRPGRGRGSSGQGSEDTYCAVSNPLGAQPPTPVTPFSATEIPLAAPPSLPASAVTSPGFAGQAGSLPPSTAAAPTRHVLGSSLYAVMDGHGGGRAAEWLRSELHTNLLAAWRECDADLASLAALQEAAGGALQTAIRTTDAQLAAAVEGGDGPTLGRGARDARFDGSTVVAALAVLWVPGGGGHATLSISIASVGDSAALLVWDDGSYRLLTSPHLPSDPGEAARLASAGAAVEGGRVGGLLAMSRSVGDPGLGPAVSADADVVHFTLDTPPPGCAGVREANSVPLGASASTPVDPSAPPLPPQHSLPAMLVLATDGLWDFVPPRDVAALVCGCTPRMAAPATEAPVPAGVHDATAAPQTSGSPKRSTSANCVLGPEPCNAPSALPWHADRRGRAHCAAEGAVAGRGSGAAGQSGVSVASAGSSTGGVGSGGGAGLGAVHRQDVRVLAERCCAEAVVRGGRDDVTVMAVDLRLDAQQRSAESKSISAVSGEPEPRL